MLIINDEKVCSECGAYQSAYERCANGHLPNKWISLKEYYEIKGERQLKKIFHPTITDIFAVVEDSTIPKEQKEIRIEIILRKFFLALCEDYREQISNNIRIGD